MISSGQIYLVCFVENVADTSRALAQAPAHSTTSMDTSGQHLYGPLFIIAMYPFKVTYWLFSKFTYY